MSEIDDKIKDSIYAFAHELEKSIRIKELYLFGSYAKGTNNQYSDIDLAVVSEDFSGVRCIDHDKFIDALMNSDKAIEPIAFSIESFTDDDMFVKEIKSHCIRLI